jgi:Tfp pilus assembly protein PilX
MVVLRKVESLIQKQQGMFILIVIVIVAVLANISLLGMSNTLYSTRLTTGFIQYSQALQRAEFALLLSQTQLAVSRKYEVSNNKPVTLGAYPQFVSFQNAQLPAWQYIEHQKLWRNDQYTVLQRDKDGKISSSYIIEKLLIVEAGTNRDYFRMTAKGWGSDAGTAVILQSLVKNGISVDRLTRQIIH